MACLLSSIFLAVCLVGSLQASYLFRRDDLPFRRGYFHRREETHCDPLEKLIDQLVKSPGIQVYLDMARAMEPNQPIPKTTDEMFNLLKSKSGLDLRTHPVRHTIACTLYTIKSLDDIANLIGAPIDMVERYYQMGMSGFKEAFGDVDSLTTLVNVFMQYNTWMVNTGFPTMPLKGNLSFDDIRNQMQAWQDTMKKTKISKEVMVKIMNAGISPFKFSPDYTAGVLTMERMSTRRASEMLCIDEQKYRLVQKFVTQKNIEGLNHLAGTLVKIIQELNKMGLFSLERE